MSLWKGLLNLINSTVDDIETKVDVIDGYQDVPAQNVADNVVMSDVIGNKTDTHAGDSVMAVLYELKEHIHMTSKCYPTGAAGVAVVATAGVWTLGNYAEIVPVSTITSDFDIHFINIEAVSAAATYEIVLYAATVEIGRFRITTLGTPNNIKLNPAPFICAIQPANTQIQAKVMTETGAADSVTISLFYHEY